MSNKLKVSTAVASGMIRPARGGQGMTRAMGTTSEDGNVRLE